MSRYVNVIRERWKTEQYITFFEANIHAGTHGQVLPEVGIEADALQYAQPDSDRTESSTSKYLPVQPPVYPSYLCNFAVAS